MFTQRHRLTGVENTYKHTHTTRWYQKHTYTHNSQVDFVGQEGGRPRHRGDVTQHHFTQQTSNVLGMMRGTHVQRYNIAAQALDVAVEASVGGVVRPHKPQLKRLQ